MPETRDAWITFLIKKLKAKTQPELFNLVFLIVSIVVGVMNTNHVVIT